jgi:hypothetical protein
MRKEGAYHPRLSFSTPLDSATSILPDWPKTILPDFAEFCRQLAIEILPPEGKMGSKIILPPTLTPTQAPAELFQTLRGWKMQSSQKLEPDITT